MRGQGATEDPDFPKEHVIQDWYLGAAFSSSHGLQLTRLQPHAVGEWLLEADCGPVGQAN
jgi:hypothetical protein